MEKTLDIVTLVHRLILAVALALFLVGISIQPANLNYDRAEEEINTLAEGITAVSEQVDQGYKAIYERSELRAAALAWLRQRNQKQEDIYIEIKTPPDLTVPDATQDPLVTLDAQVQWADRVYRDLDFPFLLCEVQRSALFHALDQLFGPSAKPVFSRLRVFVSRNGGKNEASEQQFSCSIELRYEAQSGTIAGERSAILDIPTTVLRVEAINSSGRNLVDLDIPEGFKGAGLGDFEDTRAILVPALWGLWADVGTRSPASARSLLEQRKEEESEKSKERIEILGESLNRSVTIVMACVVELCLMAYLLAHLLQVRRLLPGQEAALAESPFYGVMGTMFGKVLMLFTFVLPFGACMFALVWVLPPLSAEWPGPAWVVAREARWLLAALVGVIDSLLIWQVIRTVASLNAGASPSRVPAGTSKEPHGEDRVP